MKLSEWIRMHEAANRGAKPLGWILAGQLTLALAALGLNLTRVCGACGDGDGIHAAIAGLGVAHYVILLCLLRAKAWTGLLVGLFFAAGIHLSLGGLMIARASFCPICVAASLLSLAGPAVMLANDRRAVRWIPRVAVPAFLLSSLLTWSLFSSRDARAEAQKAEARTAAKLLLDQVRGSGVGTLRTSLELHVFESEHCAYCREFRRDYAPRLAQDFPDVDVVYHDAAGVLWVRRTPTIALGAALAFEGLPVNYQDLYQAVSQYRASRLAAAL